MKPECKDCFLFVHGKCIARKGERWCTCKEVKQLMEKHMIKKLKTIEENSCINYEYGAIKIKEDTDVESPVAIVPFPVGRPERGMERQRQYAKLMAAAPELLEKLERLTQAIGLLDDSVLKGKYADVVIAFDEATKLIKCIKED